MYDCYIAVCKDGYYGHMCDITCGQCKDGHACDKHNGTCFNDCVTNFQPPQCKGNCNNWIFLYWNTDCFAYWFIYALCQLTW